MEACRVFNLGFWEVALKPVTAFNHGSGSRVYGFGSSRNKKADNHCKTLALYTPQSYFNNLGKPVVASYSILLPNEF